MTKRPNQSRSSHAKPRPRGGWLGLAVGAAACLGAIVYVTAEAMSGPSGSTAAADRAAPDSSADRKVDLSDVAAVAHLTGNDLPAEVQTMLEGSSPAHLEYDAANNRHWWAPHNHWHDGPPPAGPVTANLPAGATPIEAPPFDMNAPAVMPDGTAPEPWEFDAANNRHWHAGHGHWHQGPPPPPEQRQ